MDLRVGPLKGLLHRHTTDKREPDRASLNAERLGNEIEGRGQTRLSGGGVRKRFGGSWHVLLRGNTGRDPGYPQIPKRSRTLHGIVR